MQFEERRSAKRYRLRFPLKVRWPGARESVTETVEVSSRAVYFFLTEALDVGTPIQFVFTFFPEPGEAQSVRLRCEGHVQRAEEASRGRIGIAASIDDYEFDWR